MQFNLAVEGNPVRGLGKFLTNEASRRMFPSFVSFCVAGAGAALGFLASALSIHWLSIVAFVITVLGVLGGFVFIFYGWWRLSRGE